MLLTIVVFILVLGILVFVHEFGHFITAKKAGVRVEEFGFGFPPRVFGVKKGETIYSLNWIPLGGFVKIYGEDGEDRKDPRSFSSKTIGRRAIIIVAGVTLNIVLAMVLLSISNLFGSPAIITDKNRSEARNLKVQITEIAPGSPAEESGLEVGDAISSLTVGNLRLIVSGTKDIQDFVNEHKGEEIALGIKRGGEEVTISLASRTNPPEGEGAMGIAMAETGIIAYPWYEAIWRGVEDTFILLSAITVGIFRILKELIITGGVDGKILGPVGIAVVTGQMARMGFVYILNFIAILSVNLAIINVLPFPALDGGRLLFLGIERVKGGPVSPGVEKIIHAVGFLLLIALMILITFKDVGRYF